MTHDRKLTFGKQMKAMEERLQALEASPRVREAMTAAGLTPPVAPPTAAFLKSAASLWPTAIRKPTGSPVVSRGLDQTRTPVHRQSGTLGTRRVSASGRSKPKCLTSKSRNAERSGKVDFSTVPRRSTVTSQFITLTRPSAVTALARIPLTNRELE
jgi:hypothetical protein